MPKLTGYDRYLEKLDEAEEEKERNANESFVYGGGYEASKGDWEGACLARAEYEYGGAGGYL